MIKTFKKFILEKYEDDYDEKSSPSTIKRLKKLADKFNIEFFSDDYYKTEGIDACFQSSNLVYYTIYPITYNNEGMFFTDKQFNEKELSKEFYEFIFIKEDDIQDAIKQYRIDIKSYNKITDKEKEYESKGKTYDPLENDSLDDLDDDN